LVGTPGRICQFLDERILSLKSIDYLVIDEADRLLDMGFEKDLTRISRSFPRHGNRQSVLCSATFPLRVQRLASDFLNKHYYFVSVGKVGSTHSLINHQFEWIDIYAKGKLNPKVNAVIKNVERFWADPNLKRDKASVIVFANTKDGANLYGRVWQFKKASTSYSWR
jgi:superfamily II DNA/RNA helicase